MKFKKLLPATTFLLILSFMFYQPLMAQEHEGEGLSIGGYGELHYNDMVYNANEEETAGNLDFHRFILAFGYEFNDWISFESELALEHTLIAIEPGGAEGGELTLEQAYIDLEFQEEFGVRVGLLYVPVGIVSMAPEPTEFYSVERPNLEIFLIPSTWSESGIGIYGSFESGFSYKAYLMAGLAPNEITGFAGIREARQRGFKSSTANLAFTARMDYRANENLSVGISYFYSDLNSEIEEGSAEEIPSLDDAKINLVEGHLLVEKGRFEARGLLVYSKISDIVGINEEFNHNAGESQLGGYVALAYDILPFFVEETEQELFIFGRYENYDTQYTTAQITDNPEFHRIDYTFGLTYKPVEQVVFKADYQIFTSAGDKSIRVFNLGIGYEF